MISFVCSVGNVPLAAILWKGGMSFAGVISFIFADLIILPIIRIHGRYYSRRVSAYLLAVSYVTMAAAGLAVGLLFKALGSVPTDRAITVFATTISWNSDTFLDIAVLAVVAVLGVRFLRTGGVEMMRMMNHPGGHEEHGMPAAHAHDGH